ncbi:type IV pilus inner membrane component PilO [Methylotetracoccus oryzae]|uniref:type 4a pilus biogenesis protein PilO n=1 Tax=Methylotetracoccus oryzae TaxID=1919059 RepID=UPI001F247E75|nr:type 4a pilus biogenesis protein PilO [Methylotetracoccus oryzae]
MNLDLTQIDWDLERAGTWPLAVKALVIGVLCIATTGVWYYLDTRNQLEELAAEEAQESQLKQTFEIKQKKAVNLEAYKKQLVEIQQTFGDLLKQLPDKTQVPDVLVDVSQTGLASGLEFELFKPAEEVNKEFYAELPIQIRVVGDFLKFGTFVSGLAALPRIVTIHNIKISRRTEGNTKGGKEQLLMDAVVKTYRYLDETAAKPPAPKVPPKPK